VARTIERLRTVLSAPGRPTARTDGTAVIAATRRVAIAEATQLWLDSREDESALARGVLLQAMRDATQPGAGSLQLTSTEERFLAASVERARAEERTVRQRTRRLAVLATVTSLRAVPAATLTVVAGNARAEALLAREEAL